MINVLKVFLFAGGMFAVSFFACGQNYTVHKNIPYIGPSEKSFDANKHVLDVYAPKDKTVAKEVLVFIHGGSWKSGRKSLYKFLGKGFASKGIVAVIINYRLTPEVNYFPMTMDCASAVKWVYENIKTYGGNPDKIIVSGHSAGGHLAALISNDDHFFDSLKIKNPIKGCILVDGFGLDMYHYFPNNKFWLDDSFKRTFTTHPETWKEASPLYHLKSYSPPQMILIGEKTYPSIKEQGRAYKEKADQLKVQVSYQILPHKGHIGMIFQFVRKNNPMYQTILAFIR